MDSDSVSSEVENMDVASMRYEKNKFLGFDRDWAKRFSIFVLNYGSVALSCDLYRGLIF